MPIAGGNPLASQNISAESYSRQPGPNTSGGKNQSFVSLGIKQLTTSTPPLQNYWNQSNSSSLGINSTTGTTNVKYLTPAPSTFSVYIAKDLYVAGKIYGSVATISDVNLKENIGDLSLKIDCNKMMELIPKEYIYKEDESKQIHYGLIAQDLEKIYPQLVSEFVHPETQEVNKSVNYTELIPILILKMQNMQKQIDELRRKEWMREQIQ